MNGVGAPGRNVQMHTNFEPVKFTVAVVIVTMPVLVRECCRIRKLVKWEGGRTFVTSFSFVTGLASPA